MFIVHHLNNSRSQRVLWALEELELPYELKCYARDPKTMFAPPELKDVHPLGLSPVVEHDAADGVRIKLAESGAILEHLGALGGAPLRPTTGPAAVDCMYWLHYAEGSLMPLLLLKLVMKQISGPKVPFVVRPIAKAVAGQVDANFTDPRVTLHLDFIDQHLAKTGWFAGDQLTIADIQMSFPLLAAAHRAGLAERTHIREWLARIQARPAFVAAIAKGGPISFD
ncbi:MAG: glutathione S-transferase [Myxococcales bacterium]|nr:glutathione S-transferase [Myxococcales bacterium]